jgi:integrase
MSAAQLSIFRVGDSEHESAKAGGTDDPRNPIIDEQLLDRIATDKGWSRRTKAEYRTNFTALQKWWGCNPRSPGPMRFQDLDRPNLTQFLAWRFATADGCNAGRTHNKAVEQLSCLLRWGLHEDRSFVDSMPRMPEEREQRTEAGIFYLEHDEIDQIYWATFDMPNPRGWASSLPVGAYLRCGLVLFWNLALDTQTVAPCEKASEACALRRSDFFFSRRPPSRQMPIESEFGFLWTTRNKTGKDFERAMNREIHDHVRVILGDDAEDSLLMSSGGRRAWTYRPNRTFQRLCAKAKIEPKIDRQTRKPKQWNLKDLRKTSGAFAEVGGDYSPAADMLGHSDSKVTYGHYVSGNIRASLAVMRQPQPASFRSIWDDSIKPPGLLFVK